MDLNRASLIGNVTKDIESRTTPNGKNVASFSIATNSQWKDASGTMQKRAEYHNLVAWGKLAEICAQYLNRGTKIYAEGRLETREYTTQDGQKRSRTEIILENMIILSPKGTTASNPVPHTAGLPEKEPAQDDIRVEDIPF